MATKSLSANEILELEKTACARLEELNETFAIAGVGTVIKDTRVAEFTPGHQRFIGWRAYEAFDRHLVGETVITPGKVKEAENGGLIPIQRGDWTPLSRRWRDEYGRAKRYSRLVCAPPGSSELPLEPEAYNLWQRGFAVDPKKGDWSKIKDFILTIICDGDEEIYEWVFNWIAALVQRPGQRAHSAIVLKGDEGIGKGFLADEVIGRLFLSDHWTRLGKAEHLTGRFNDHLRNKVFVFADEATWPTQKHADILKGYITERTIPIEQKFVPLEEVENMLHLIIASNNESPVLVGRSDRRYAVLQVNESKKRDTSYFAGLARVLSKGGRAAFLYDLQQHKVDWDALRLPPDTDAKTTMKADSLDDVAEWWREVLARASEEKWKPRRANDALLRQYQQWCRDNGTRYTLENVRALGDWFERHFTRAGVSGEFQRGRNIKIHTPNGRLYAFEFPDLALCRDIFRESTGVNVD